MTLPNHRNEVENPTSSTAQRKPLAVVGNFAPVSLRAHMGVKRDLSAARRRIRELEVEKQKLAEDIATLRVTTGAVVQTMRVLADGQRAKLQSAGVASPESLLQLALGLGDVEFNLWLTILNIEFPPGSARGLISG